MRYAIEIEKAEGNFSAYVLTNITYGPGVFSRIRVRGGIRSLKPSLSLAKGLSLSIENPERRFSEGLRFIRIDSQGPGCSWAL